MKMTTMTMCRCIHFASANKQNLKIQSEKLANAHTRCRRYWRADKCALKNSSGTEKKSLQINGPFFVDRFAVTRMLLAARARAHFALSKWFTHPKFTRRATRRSRPFQMINLFARGSLAIHLWVQQVFHPKNLSRKIKNQNEKKKILSQAICDCVLARTVRIVLPWPNIRLRIADAQPFKLNHNLQLIVLR